MYFKADFYCFLWVQGLAYIKFVSPREKLWVYEAGLAGKKITDLSEMFLKGS